MPRALLRSRSTTALPRRQAGLLPNAVMHNLGLAVASDAPGHPHSRAGCSPLTERVSEHPPSRSAEASAVARAALREFLGFNPLSAALRSDVELVVSELVTNAVRHGEGEIRLVLSYDEVRLTGEVIDDGQGFEATVRDEGLTAIGGWGLRRWPR